jgi:DNA-binding CsgD family transcriptional regulator
MPIWISDKKRPFDVHVSVSYGIPAEVMRMMAASDYRDPWVSRMDLATAPIGIVVPSESICPDEILEQDPWYGKLLLPYKWHYGGGVMLQMTETESAGVSTLRPKERGPLRHEEKALWQSLVPHLDRAVRIHGWRTRVASERDALLRFFDDIVQGVMIVSAEGTLLAANQRARIMLESGQVLRQSDGRLEATDPADGRRLREALKVTGLTVHKPESFVLQGKGGNGHQPSAVIYLRDSGTCVEFDPAPLRMLFAMTAAEAGLACRLATGESLAQAAGSLHVSIHTVRSHLKQALAKADVKRQAELAVLVMRVCQQKIEDHSIE